jgi:hypothetical protein
MTVPLTPEHFLPHVKKLFRVKGGHHALMLTKVEVRQSGRPSPAPRPQFNLIFSGPPGDVLREALYTLEVEGGPLFDLYVIPIQTLAKDRQEYQSPFN